MKTAWLLEWKYPKDGSPKGGSVVYWGHFSYRRNCTADANEAVHFADKRSAIIVQRTLPGGMTDDNKWEAVEHGFCEPLQKDPLYQATLNIKSELHDLIDDHEPNCGCWHHQALMDPQLELAKK